MQTISLCIIKAGRDLDNINHFCQLRSIKGADQDSVRKKMFPCFAFIFREREELGEIKRQLIKHCL